MIYLGDKIKSNRQSRLLGPLYGPRVFYPDAGIFFEIQIEPQNAKNTVKGKGWQRDLPQL
jgi:hypothetical protein